MHFCKYDSFLETQVSLTKDGWKDETSQTVIVDKTNATVKKVQFTLFTVRLSVNYQL